MQQELARLFDRDLQRLLQEIEAFPDDACLWATVPGVTNSAGNLALHLNGNLREFVGRQLGNVAYIRQRDHEFAGKGLPIAEMYALIDDLRYLVPLTVERLSDEQLATVGHEDHVGVPITNRQFLMHLYAHFSYHLGEIDYLRRILTNGQPIRFAGLAK